jgi:hypothetical protein
MIEQMPCKEYNELRNAIILQACKDYYSSIKAMHKWGGIEIENLKREQKWRVTHAHYFIPEIRRFFLKEASYYGIDEDLGEKILRKLEQMAKDKKRHNFTIK